ncbi:MAG: DUF5076 domain-containing protein [Planctomycetes bacterium]|nr:DUF5076 domain-containing protein [Planctomycetota bacterium]
MKRLPVPAPAISDPHAQEMLTAFIADKRLQCSFNVGQWGPGQGAEKAWGVLLADVAQHIARALRHAHKVDQQQALDALVASFNAELRAPTADHGGDFVES